MKEQEKKRFLQVFIGVLAIMISISTPVYAESLISFNEMTDDERSEDTEDNYAEDTVYSLLRGSDLNLGTVSIREVSSGQVNVYGVTQCHHVCGTVYLSLYLERKVNGTYSTYKYWNFSTGSVTNLTKSINVIVPSGYYRVRGYHATSNDGRKESISTLTDAIKVS